MADKEYERTLEETSTWTVAVVCFVLILISLLIEHLIHKIGSVSPSWFLLLPLFFYLYILRWLCLVLFFCFLFCFLLCFCVSCHLSLCFCYFFFLSPLCFILLWLNLLFFFNGSGSKRSTRGIFMKLLKKLKQVEIEERLRAITKTL